MKRTLKIKNGYVLKTIKQEGLVEIRIPIKRIKVISAQSIINQLGDLRIK
jgi:hypothetical protein